jgi:hypothetical protein
MLRWLHIASHIWGILTELFPWRCPLTVMENYLEGRAGVEPYLGKPTTCPRNRQLHRLH